MLSLSLSPLFFQTNFNLEFGSVYAYTFFLLLVCHRTVSFQAFHFFYLSVAFFLVVREWVLKQSAFVFIIECALDWFMARTTNLKYESSFGFRWFVYSPLFFGGTSTSATETGAGRTIFSLFVLSSDERFFSLSLSFSLSRFLSLFLEFIVFGSFSSHRLTNFFCSL